MKRDNKFYAIIAFTALIFTFCSSRSIMRESSGVEDRQAIEITIYNNNLGIVTERRSVTFPAGRGELRFVDVAAQIDPTSVHIVSLDYADDLTISEQNFEYDLISHARLLEKYVDEVITIIVGSEQRGSRDTVGATVLSANKGEVYQIEGAIHLDYPGIRVIPKIPDNLVSRPTLTWRYDSRVARDYHLEVSYATEGITWAADYVLVVGESREEAEFSGWVTIDNRSGATYDETKLMLVAGAVNTLPRYRPQRFEEIKRREIVSNFDFGPFSSTNTSLSRRFSFEAGEIIGYLDNPTPVYMIDMDFDEAVSAARFEKRGMFEYHIYDLPRPTTIKNNQTKQIKLLEVSGIELEKEYILTPSYLFHWDGNVALWSDDYEYFQALFHRMSTHSGESWQVKSSSLEGHAVKQEVGEYFTFNNSENNNLGNPLPSGEVMVYSISENGRRLFLGENTIPHTPSDEEVRFRVGGALGIVAERTLVDFKKGLARSTETEWEITVRNRRDTDIDIRVEENASGEWEILKSTHEYVKVDAETFKFDLSVGKGQEVVVRYRIRGENRQ
ncbi:MAG: DUF4139 domain-containing protein [Chitinispirillales bacterium]|jgi:hypothetical protein|nr:DUF4139 domain-containing protein [Chitinispirillales bacterium]